VTISRNCNLAQHVCLNCNVNIYEGLKTACFQITLEHQLQKKMLLLENALLPTQNIFFNTLCMVQINPADDSGDIAPPVRLTRRFS
jgi:hypothetical protein